jgi:phage terminase large subunit-like protein
MDLTKTLKSYCKNILNDKPLSCQKHKWACERFLSDFDRQGTKAFPYVFIPKKATRFIKWCALFKHTQGVLVGQSIDLYYTPILLFIFSNIYGWYHKDTGNRRFNKMYWQVARKNVKSQSLALVGSY